MSTEVPAGHPDPEVLAGLDDAYLPAEREAEVRRHVDECGDCRRTLSRFAQLRQGLAGGPERMPADVVARIGAAVHTAGSARRAGQVRRAAAAAPLGADLHRDGAPGRAADGPDGDREPQRPGADRGPGGSAPVRSLPLRSARSGGRWAVAAAAGVVLLLGVTLAAGLSRVGGEKTSSSAAGSARASAPAPGTITESGRDYTAQNVARGVGVVAGKGSGRISGSASSPAPAAAAEAAGSPLRSPAALAACVAELAGRPGVAPLRVDLAEFQHEAAAVIVLPVPRSPRRVQVWVVGPYCTTGAPDIRYFVTGVRANR